MKYVYIFSNNKTKEEIKLEKFINQILTTNKKKLFIKDSGIPILYYMGGNPKDALEEYLSVNDAVRSMNYFCGKDVFKLESIPLNRLAFSQDVLNIPTVRKYYRKSNIEPITVLEYKGFYFCSDGTHRAFSKMARGDKTIVAKVYHCPVKQLVTLEEAQQKSCDLIKEYKNKRKI